MPAGRKRRPVSEKLRALAEQKEQERRVEAVRDAILATPRPVAPVKPLENTMVDTGPTFDGNAPLHGVTDPEAARFRESPEPPSAAPAEPDSPDAVEGIRLLARRTYAPVPYEPHLIYQFAARLYSRAAVTIVMASVAGIPLGAILGGFIGQIVAMFATGSLEQGLDHVRTEIAVLAVLGGVFGAVAGYLVGVEMAFWIKLKAQLTLCQLKIEENTRGMG